MHVIRLQTISFACNSKHCSRFCWAKNFPSTIKFMFRVLLFVISWSFIPLIKQQFAVTYRYTIIQATAINWPIFNRPSFNYVIFLRKYTDKQFIVDTTFWQEVCLWTNCLVSGNLSLKNCVGYDKLSFHEWYVLRCSDWINTLKHEEMVFQVFKPCSW